jgi:hypothetical protein
MKIVIQCAGRKYPGGRLKTPSGEIVFVAAPELCESIQPGVRYVNPNDRYEAEDITWRDKLERYNEQSENPCNLYRAADLYSPKVYQLLTHTFRPENVFILSAGWGLIFAGFWTPNYNITFSKQAKKKTPWAWRDAKDSCRWSDFNHLKEANISPNEEIHFFGGEDYLPAFYAHAESVAGRKIIHHKVNIKHHLGFEYRQFQGPQRTTWYYKAVMDFVRAASS